MLLSFTKYCPVYFILNPRCAQYNLERETLVIVLKFIHKLSGLTFTNDAGPDQASLIRFLTVCCPPSTVFSETNEKKKMSK